MPCPSCFWSVIKHHNYKCDMSNHVKVLKSSKTLKLCIHRASICSWTCYPSVRLRNWVGTASIQLLLVCLLSLIMYHYYMIKIILARLSHAEVLSHLQTLTDWIVVNIPLFHNLVPSHWPSTGITGKASNKNICINARPPPPVSSHCSPTCQESEDHIEESYKGGSVKHQIKGKDSKKYLDRCQATPLPFRHIGPQFARNQ